MDEMSSSAWALMKDDDCDCGGPPPLFHLPPPPVPPDLPCELMDMNCPALLNVSDAEFKRIGSFPSVTVIVGATLSAVVLLVIAVIVWRKKRKGVTQTKDFDSHHGPTMMNGTAMNGVLYEDLAHARPRPPMAPPSIEMLDVNHTLNSNGMLGNPNIGKLDFSYFLNPPPIYEELPDHSDRNNGPSEDEFAEDELSVIDVPISHTHESDANNPPSRYHNSITRPNKPPNKSASLTRKRPSRNSSSSGGGFKSQRSLDRRSRGNVSNSNKYPGTNPRLGGGPGTVPRQFVGLDTNNPGSMLILSNGMKIPPHLVAVLTESALCNGSRYEVMPTGHPIQGIQGVSNGSVVNCGNPTPGIYPSSRSSGSSYGDGSSSGSARNNQVNSIESSSFDSGIGPHSIASFLNSPAYDQTVLPPAYPVTSYEYAAATGGNLPPQYNMVSQHPSFRRLRMAAVVDRDHPLYSNHLLT